MIVWGGNDENFDPLNTGGRYNPGLDTWTPTSTTNVPSARVFHTAVWTGSEMIVWGGATSSLLLTLAGGTIQARTVGQLRAPPMRRMPENAHAVWTGSEMIVWGG